MRLTNSVAYARDLKELHITTVEAAEELKLHQIFMERPCFAIHSGQSHGYVQDSMYLG